MNGVCIYQKHKMLVIKHLKIKATPLGEHSCLKREIPCQIVKRALERIKKLLNPPFYEGVLGLVRIAAPLSFYVISERI